MKKKGKFVYPKKVKLPDYAYEKSQIFKNIPKQEEEAKLEDPDRASALILTFCPDPDEAAAPMKVGDWM